MKPNPGTILLLLSFLCYSCSQPKADQTNRRTWEESDRLLLTTHLKTSLDAVLQSVDALTEEQWNWQPDSDSWSIALVVEHLITHDELFYREVRVLSNLPTMPPQKDSEFASDEKIMSYAEITAQNIGQAPSYLEPQGRWCDKDRAMASYKRSRNALIAFVGSTSVNLRAYYTKSGRGPTTFRDLHQLLLISVAHTQRHHQQILSILSNPAFPAN